MSTGRLPPPEPVIELSTNSPVTSLTFDSLKTQGEGELTLFSGHEDGKVIKWNWVTRRPESFTAAHAESVIWLTCMSEKLVSQGRDGVKFWTVSSQEWTVIGEVPCATLTFCNSSLCNFNKQHLLTVPSDSVAQVTVHFLEQLSTESSEIVHLSHPIHLQPTDTKSYGMCMCLKSEADDSRQVTYLFVAYESGILLMWDLFKGEILTEVKAHNESIMCIDCWSSRDTGLIKCVTGSVDEQLKLWQVDNLKLTHNKTINILNPGMSNISVRGDGKIVAVGGWDGNCRVFSFKTLKALAVLTFHRSTVQCVTFASNNLLATGSKDGYIALWNIYNT